MGRFDSAAIHLERLRILGLGVAGATLAGMVAPSLLELRLYEKDVDLTPPAPPHRGETSVSAPPILGS